MARGRAAISSPPAIGTWPASARPAPTAPLRLARAFHGAWLDAFVYAEAAFTVIDPDLLRFLPARILVDERGFAKTLIERVNALDKKGPPLLPEGEDEMVRVW
jgi:hypothetical protein